MNTKATRQGVNDLRCARRAEAVREVSIEEYRALVGKELGVSRWFEIDQDRIERK